MLILRRLWWWWWWWWWWWRWGRRLRWRWWRWGRRWRWPPCCEQWQVCPPKPSSRHIQTWLRGGATSFGKKYFSNYYLLKRYLSIEQKYFPCEYSNVSNILTAAINYRQQTYFFTTTIKRHDCVCVCRGYISLDENSYFSLHLIWFCSIDAKPTSHQLNEYRLPEQWENHVRDSMFFFTVGMDHSQRYQPFLNHNIRIFLWKKTIPAKMTITIWKRTIPARLTSARLFVGSLCYCCRVESCQRGTASWPGRSGWSIWWRWGWCIPDICHFFYTGNYTDRKIYTGTAGGVGDKYQVCADDVVRVAACSSPYFYLQVGESFLLGSRMHILLLWKIFSLSSF